MSKIFDMGKNLNKIESLQIQPIEIPEAPSFTWDIATTGDTADEAPPENSGTVTWTSGTTAAPFPKVNENLLETIEKMSEMIDEQVAIPRYYDGSGILPHELPEPQFMDDFYKKIFLFMCDDIFFRSTIITAFHEEIDIKQHPSEFINKIKICVENGIFRHDKTEEIIIVYCEFATPFTKLIKIYFDKGLFKQAIDRFTYFENEKEKVA